MVDWNKVIQDSMPGVVEAAKSVLGAMLPLFIFVIVVRIAYGLLCRLIDRRK